MKLRPLARALLLATVAIASSVLAADIVLTPPAGGGVAVTNAAGNATRFRVGDDGTIAFPALGIVPGTFTGLCLEVATGKIGTCAMGGGGTVSSVSAGAGLTGGTITTSGTIGLAATQLLPTAACTTNQVPKWGGTAWTCAGDNNTLYSAGSGLSLLGTTLSTDNAVVARKDPAAGNQAFDGNTLFLDFANNRVGVLNGAPAYPLDVSGTANMTTARAGSYTYASAQTRYYTVAAAEFVASSSTVAFGDNNLRPVSRYLTGASTTTVYLDAPLHLPDGAAVTNLSCKVIDNSATYDVVAVGIAVTPGDGGANLVCGFASTTGATAGAQTVVQSCSGTINNNGNAYFVTVGLVPACGNACAVNACTVAYTVTTAN